MELFSVTAKYKLIVMRTIQSSIKEAGKYSINSNIYSGARLIDNSEIFTDNKNNSFQNLADIVNFAKEESRIWMNKGDEERTALWENLSTSVLDYLMEEGEPNYIQTNIN